MITLVFSPKQHLPINMQHSVHKAFFSNDRYLDSLHKSFLNQATLDLRKEKWTFLNQDFTVLPFARNYKPRLVYFLPHFWVRFIIKSYSIDVLTRKYRPKIHGL